jgi:hypothetical protein
MCIKTEIMILLSNLFLQTTGLKRTSNDAQTFVSDLFAETKVEHSQVLQACKTQNKNKTQ